MNVVAVTVVPVVVAVLFIGLSSLLREPARRNFMALMLAGAGAVYISGGGLGMWEFAFAPLLVYCSYRGLTSYRFIGAGWLLHSSWDVVHHVYGHPIIPFSATSSLGCAVCDPVIAAWCFAGAPPLHELVRGKFRRGVARAS
jgi:hypothetical protein